MHLMYLFYELNDINGASKTREVENNEGISFCMKLCSNTYELARACSGSYFRIYIFTFVVHTGKGGSYRGIYTALSILLESGIKSKLCQKWIKDRKEENNFHGNKKVF
jgi:hypothetical protein